MMRLIVVAALLLVLPAYTLAGAVGGPKSGTDGDEEVQFRSELKIRYEGGHVAAIAVSGHARWAPQIEVFDPSGKRVGFARSILEGGRTANLAVWVPDKTGVYRIKITNQGASWSYKTN